MSTPIPRSRWISRSRSRILRLHRHVERGRRLVGEQQGGLAGQRHRDHDALPHAAAHLERVGLEPARRGEGSARARAAPAPAAAACARDSGRCRRSVSTSCFSTVKTGSSAVIGSWKTIETSRAADVGARPLRQRQQVTAVQQDLARLARGRGLDAEDRAQQRALAAAGLPDDRHDAAVAEAQRDVVDGGHISGPGAEGGADPAQLQQRRARRCRGGRGRGGLGWGWPPSGRPSVGYDTVGVAGSGHAASGRLLRRRRPDGPIRSGADARRGGQLRPVDR